MSKKAENFIERYCQSRKHTLWDCYKTYSREKELAEFHLKREMQNTGGNDFRIISHNTSKFTCGWTTKEGNLRIVTADNSYIIEMPF